MCLSLTLLTTFLSVYRYFRYNFVGNFEPVHYLCNILPQHVYKSIYYNTNLMIETRTKRFAKAVLVNISGGSVLRRRGSICFFLQIYIYENPQDHILLKNVAGACIRQYVCCTGCLAENPDENSGKYAGKRMKIREIVFERGGRLKGEWTYTFYLFFLV